MADPELLVDEADRLIDGRALVRGNADVGQRQELQHAIVLAPHAAQLILRPAAGYGGDDLVVAHPVVRPAMRFEIGFERVDRRLVLALVLKLVGDHRRTSIAPEEGSLPRTRRKMMWPVMV